MKQKTILFAGSSLASLFLLTGINAQTAPQEGRNGDLHSRSLSHSSSSPVKASDLVGMKIENAASEKVGRVDDLAIDLQAGRILHVIVSTGGILSMGDRTLAVPTSGFMVSSSDKVLRSDLTADRIKGAPAFEMSKWSDYYGSDRAVSNDQYYLQAPASGRRLLQGENRTPARGSDEVGFVQRSSKIVGLPVRNLQDEKIGTVEDLVLDLPASRVVAVIVSTGGFLRMGDTLSAVPPAALRFNAEHDRLSLDTTKEALTKAPRFKSGEWPDFAQGDYAASLHRAYNVESRSTGDRNRSADADNSARNRRDRDNQSLTPADQGGNVTDVTLTQQIRKAVVAAKGLSINAQNVKIITVNSRVTLRGPVATAEEKMRIGEIAAAVATPGNVDNQLEVTAR